MTTMKERVSEAQEAMALLGKEYPGLQGPFGVLKRHSIENDGALPSKMKRLIALSIGLANGCEWCIALHTKGAMDAGATKDEIIEACYATVTMAGGPALMHIKLVLDALEEFGE